MDSCADFFMVSVIPDTIMTQSFYTFSLLFAGAAFTLTGCDRQKSADGSDASNGSGDEMIVATLVNSVQPVDLSNPVEPTGFTDQFQGLLDPVNAQCPQDYPEIVTPIPEADKLEQTDTKVLMSMLDNWNPVLRMEAAGELGKRGTDAIEELRQGTHSENNKIRAGSATALAEVCKQLSTDQLPSGLVEDFIRLTKDEEHEVRVAALNALYTLAPKTKEATLAVLALCTDPDEYLAQEAKVTLNKRFQAYAMPIEEVEDGLKAAMDGPLPNGRGHIVQIVGRLKPEDQKHFIPQLLAHLDWYTRRDTMFAGGGQQQALELLTNLKEPQVISRLPKLMGKTGRGMHLYSPALKSARAYGADAKVILPELKAILAELEDKGKEAKITPQGDIKAGIAELKKTITEIESL